MVGIGAGLLAGCGSVPNSGPSANDVLTQGAQTSDGVARGYEVVDLNDSVIDILGHRGNASFSQRFGDYRASGEPVIGIGDAVTVTIWEASAGGLFSSSATSGTGERVSAGANSATIPEQIVGRDGAITVPYAGRVHVAGRTTRAVQAVIEHALEGKAIQPQVLVSVPHAISNTVTVGGEGITTAQRVPLSVKGDRLLDVVAAAGGIKSPANETYVELARGNSTARVALTRVIRDPRENIFLRPSDVLTLVHDPQTFIAYGATGIANNEIPFGADGISLAEALAKTGGLLDARSDPQGVFVFRWESPSVVKMLRPDSALAQERREVPVVYRLNLKDPNSLFVEQKFHMANRDLIYVSNASLVQTQKVVDIFGSMLAPAVNAVGVAATVSYVRP
jgi:polysaccharide biosynthesis/export protein